MSLNISNFKHKVLMDKSECVQHSNFLQHLCIIIIVEIINLGLFAFLFFVLKSGSCFLCDLKPPFRNVLSLVLMNWNEKSLSLMEILSFLLIWIVFLVFSNWNWNVYRRSESSPLFHNKPQNSLMKDGNKPTKS